MIEVNISFLSRHKYLIREVNSIGHSTIDRKDVCSAVSTLEYTFLYSLESLSSIKFNKEIDIKKGFFKINVDFVDKQDELLYNHLCSFYLLGIKMIETNNKDFISIKEVV